MFFPAPLFVLFCENYPKRIIYQWVVNLDVVMIVCGRTRTVQRMGRKHTVCSRTVPIVAGAGGSKSATGVLSAARILYLRNVSALITNPAGIHTDL